MRIPSLILMFLLPVVAAEPPGYKHWTSGQLRDRAQSLSPKVDAHKIATERLADFGRYHALTVHREGSGQAEVHEDWADFFVVESGNAKLVVGGTIPDARRTGPGEIRGSKINGGTEQTLSAGDVVNIPARTPHQFLLDSGSGDFNAFVLKIKP